MATYSTPNTFVDATTITALSHNQNWGSVATFVNNLANGTGIDPAAIIQSLLAASSVGTAQLQTNAVTDSKILADAVTTVKIIDDAVTTAKINALAVTTAKIDALAVTTAKIAAGAVTASEISTNAVTTAKIDASAVTSAKIASGAVTSANIADNTIVNADINSAAGITDTKLATISTGGKVSNSATTATSANTGSAIVARDASGDFNARFGFFLGRPIGLDLAPAIECGGNATATSVGVLRVGNSTTGTTCITTNGNTGIGTLFHMAFHTSGTAVGGITSSGSLTSFNTTSDYRIKENVVTMENALATIEMLKPKAYNFITTPDSIHHGFLAHELQEVLPYAVTGEKDAVDDEGNIRPQQVDYSKLTGLLVGAIQELTARVKELESN